VAELIPVLTVGVSSVYLLLLSVVCAWWCISMVLEEMPRGAISSLMASIEIGSLVKFFMAVLSALQAMRLLSGWKA